VLEVRRGGPARRWRLKGVVFVFAGHWGRLSGDLDETFIRFWGDEVDFILRRAYGGRRVGCVRNSCSGFGDSCMRPVNGSPIKIASFIPTGKKRSLNFLAWDCPHVE